MKTLFTLFILLAQLTMAQSRTDGFAQGTRGLPYGMPYSMYTNLVLLMPNWEDPSNQVPWQVIDRSPAQNNGTQTTPASRPVWTNGLMRFDGLNDVIRMGATISIVGDFSLFAWIRTSSNGYFMSCGGVELYGGWALGVNFSNLALLTKKTVAGNYCYSQATTPSLTNNAWMFVGVTGTLPTNLTFYVNGASVPVTHALTGGIYSDAYTGFNSGLGARGITNGVGGTSDCYNGFLKLPLAANRALTSNEVAYLYNLTKGTYGIP